MDDKSRETSQNESSEKKSKTPDSPSLPEIELDTSTFIDSLFGSIPIKKSE